MMGCTYCFNLHALKLSHFSLQATQKNPIRTVCGSVSDSPSSAWFMLWFAQKYKNKSRGLCKGGLHICRVCCSKHGSWSLTLVRLALKGILEDGALHGQLSPVHAPAPVPHHNGGICHELALKLQLG